MTRTKRLYEIDIIKALAIIFVVMGHAGAPFTHFLYLFHVAAFFISSGFFYKSEAADSIQSFYTYLIKKIKHLWVPYFIWSAVFLLLNNIFIRINVYTDNPAMLQYLTNNQITYHYFTLPETIKNIIKVGFLFQSVNMQMAGAFWFLVILLFISIAYCISDFILKRINRSYLLIFQGLLSLLLLNAGWLLGKNNIKLFGLAKFFSIYILFYLGVLFKHYYHKYSNLNHKHYILIGLTTFTILLLLNQIGSISLVKNSYNDPLFLIAASVSGWFLLYSLSKFILLFKAKKLFLYIGKKTLCILIFHFLSFKVIALIITIINNLPSFCIASFPNLYGSKGLWWLCYTLAGVAIPICLDFLYESSIKSINKMMAGKRASNS